MVNYNNGKIYKIEDMNGEMCYIGSTTKKNLSQRMAEHRRGYQCWKAGTQAYSTAYSIFDKHGLYNCRIFLMELVPCETKDVLTSREGHYIISINCVNKVIPDRHPREGQKAYYEKNKEDILVKLKIYRDANKETRYAKQKEVIDCACGFTYTNQNKLRHMMTTKHLDALSNQTLTI